AVTVARDHQHSDPHHEYGRRGSHSGSYGGGVAADAMSTRNAHGRGVARDPQAAVHPPHALVRRAHVDRSPRAPTRKRTTTMKPMLFPSLVACPAATVPLVTLASSHREAPFIAGQPKVDGTDFYMFRSYEPGRENFVTFIANYNPLQDAYGGPNYFTLDPQALYEIRIDNDGEAKPDLTSQFRFSN